MNTLKIFENESFGKVRVIIIDNNPWFVGKDVVRTLGYTDLSHAVIDHVDKEDRVNSKTQGYSDPEFGQRGTWLVNESGLYSLIFGSTFESAKNFKHWVTSEVLPSIRRTGSYSFKDERRKSKKVRNDFTDMLKEHGYEFPWQYGRTTKNMKQILNVDGIKKDDMTREQLAAVVASECLSILTMGNEHGFKEVNMTCEKATNIVNGAIEDKNERIKKVSA